LTATPTARTIDVATLRSLLDEEAPRILDVRTPAEFEAAHIPGAYNVPLDLLREHRDELARHIGEDVVLVCRSGARASQAEQALGQVGLPGLHVLDGGMNRRLSPPAHIRDNPGPVIAPSGQAVPGSGQSALCGWACGPDLA
jgi:rhodanese-related sulfurtransferase